MRADFDSVIPRFESWHPPARDFRFGEIGERPGQPVDLVDGDDIHPAGPDLAEKLLEGGPVPLGYRCTGKMPVIVPEEADTVRLIFTRYLELGSLRTLIEELDRLGIRTKGSSSCPWSAQHNRVMCYTESG